MEAGIAPYQGEGVAANEVLAPELYHLLSDPAERVSRASEFPEIVRALKEKMKTFRVEGSRVRFK